MFKFLEKYVMGPMSVISQIPLVRAITAAGMSSITFTIVGSMFLVFNILPDAMPFLKPFFEATFFRFSDLYLLAYKASMGIISLYFVIAISYEYTRIMRDEKQIDISPINGALLAIFALFILIPELVINEGIVSLVNGNNVINGWIIGGDGPSRLAASGLFTTIIVSFIVVRIYAFCVTKKLVIKMPEAVPLGVARSFTALIPAFITAFFFLAINGILVALGTDVYKVIAIPFGFVVNLANSYLGLLVIYFLISALWIVGIHGATIITSILTPLTLSNLADNIAGANHVFAGEFNNAFVTVGGSGATLVLIFLMAFMAKSQQLKLLGRAAIVPGFFNINEPILFGLPLVYNPFMAIPFFLAPMASASIGYFAIKLHLVNPVVAQQPWPTPVGIGGFIATGGDYRGFILALITVLVAGIIYFPFFKYYDNKLLNEEKLNSNTAN